MKKLLGIASFCFLFSQLLSGQDTLPDFTVKNMGNKRIVVSWKNRYEVVKQISIQRSFDSLKNYKSILTVPDPDLPENGYLDAKADNDHMFYRLYILLDKGNYIFSNPRRPVFDTITADIRRGEMIKAGNFDMLQKIAADTAAIGPTIQKPKVEVWLPSKYVYTFKDGYVRISLPDEADKKYTLKFFTSEDVPLFELKEVKEKDFKIDKASFYRSGWYKFELYENDELKEKNKFFLPKDF